MTVFFQQRGLEPVGVVNALQGGLTPHAESAPVDGMKRIPLYFDHPSLAVFGQDAAAGRALTAGGCIPGGFADHHVIGRLYQRKEVFSGGIAAKCE